jgi:uncharacterized protein YkwD
MPRCAVLLVALTLVPFGWADEKKDDKKGELKLTADEQALIDLTNAERKKAELEPLKMNPKLMEAARKHAENMAKQDKLDHVLDEKNPTDRAKAAGYKSTYIGENVSWNQKDPKEALAEWMDSEPHRANILKKEYTEIGVAVAKNSKGEPYWVQVFGKP